MGHPRFGAAAGLLGCCALVLSCAQDVNTDPIEEETPSEHGEDCSAPEDCLEGLVCASDGVCLHPGELGTAGEGDDCDGNEFCQLGLVCDHDGECAPAGAPGTAGDGEDCGADEDCQVGLQCLDGECRGFQVPLWRGVECADPGDGTFRVHFEVPGEDPPTEFYRLPFPNDARVVDGGLDLTGHPTPGVLIEQLGDLAAEILDTAAADLDAFGNGQAVLMRFSEEINYDTLVMDDPGVGTIFVLDVTTFSGDFGTRRSGGFRAAGERGMYICGNWLAFTPAEGRPYEPGHTYAAVVTTEVRSQDGNDPVAQDDDFAAVIAGTEPADERLERAWEVYEPLRRWLDESGTDPATIAGAAVFTVQRPGDPVQALREAVHADEPPTVDGVILCEDGDPGPYADGTDRGCDGVHPDFHELQGTVRLPVFQAGVPPFKEPAHGGELADAPVDHDDVVFALTVPTAAMPAGGWPLVLVGHGDDGHYRSFVVDGLAERLAALRLDDGSDAPLAVLAIDGVVHGPRANPEAWDDAWLAVDPDAYDPAALFFNVLNPRAARDNALQAAADVFSLVRLAQTLQWDAGSSPTGEALHFDPDRVLYLGHGPGAVAGVTAVSQEPGVHAVGLAGAGGPALETLLGRTHPRSPLDTLKIALADTELHRHHPVLNLLQAVVERSDPINHAGAVAHDPGDDPPRHVLQLVGLGDTSAPDASQAALARALYLDQVLNAQDPLDYLDVALPPVTGNLTVDGLPVTAAAALHEPTGGAQAHDVLYELEGAVRQLDQFLGTAAVDGVPTVVQP